jgi:hypothetical protein
LRMSKLSALNAAKIRPETVPVYGGLLTWAWVKYGRRRLLAGVASVPQFLEKAIRFQNYAEELRVIAADRTTAENSAILLRVAADYERMAKSLEAMSTVKTTRGLPPADFNL